MTVKTRNRVNYIFTIISAAFFVSCLAFLIFQLATNKFSFPEIYKTERLNTNFLFGFRPYFSLAGILFEGLSVTFISYITLRAFSKTQSSVLFFFLVFLFANYVDFLRILLIFFHISGTFTQLLIIAGHTTVFARFLEIFSLLMILLMTYDDDITNTNRNFLIIFIGSLFLSSTLPINTSRIHANFSVSYSFHSILIILTVIIIVAGAVLFFFYNKNNHYEQQTTAGFILFSLGFTLISECSSLFMLILASSMICVGIPLYLIHLHNEYLWK